MASHRCPLVGRSLGQVAVAEWLTHLRCKKTQVRITLRPVVFITPAAAIYGLGRGQVDWLGLRVLLPDIRFARVITHPTLSLHSSNEPCQLLQWLWSWWKHRRHCRGYYYYLLLECVFVVVKLTDRHQLNSLVAHSVEVLYLKGNPLSDDFKDMKVYVRYCTRLVFYVPVFTALLRFYYLWDRIVVLAYG